MLYLINSDPVTRNQASHASLLAQITIDSSVMSEIQNALAVGKEVLVHQSPITQHGWTGSGYVITDVETGAGAYKISGGANGAFILTLTVTILAFLAVYGVFLIGPLWLAITLLVWESTSLLFWLQNMKNSTNDSEFNRANAGQAIGAILGLMPTGGVIWAEASKWFGLIFMFMLTNYDTAF